MRLTADLINRSLSYINPLMERELDLRGHRIPQIENLGVAGDYQESIDFTDNDITTLGNLPLSPRLKTLLLARNRISSISPSLQKQTPNLSTLVLTANRLAELADLEPLAPLAGLTHLVLLDNPVAQKQEYRYFVLSRIPALRSLDFRRVRQSEREKAQELFGSREAPTTAALAILGKKSAAPAAGAGANGATGGVSGGRVKLTPKERKRVEEMLRGAKSLEEIARIERELNEGRIPGGVILDDEMED